MKQLSHLRQLRQLKMRLGIFEEAGYLCWGGYGWLLVYIKMYYHCILLVPFRKLDFGDLAVKMG